MSALIWQEFMHTYEECMFWVQVFATCAIEGNQLGVEMVELWNSGQRQEFVNKLNKLKRRWSNEPT